MKFWWWVRACVLALIVVPLLAHGVALLCLFLNEMMGKGLRVFDLSRTISDSFIATVGFYIFGGLLMSVLGWLLARFTPPKENNAMRQALLLLPAIWVLSAWAIVFQLAELSFSSHGYNDFLAVTLPWSGINLLSLLSGQYGAMVIIPVGAQACFTLGCYWRNRYSPDSQKSIKLRNTLVWVLVALTLFAGWQAKLRLDKFPLVDRDNPLSESIDTWNYDPKKENNKLTKLRGAAPFTFTIKHPRFDGATAAYPLFASAFFALNTFADDMPFYEIEKSWLGISRTPDAYKNIIADRADIIFVAQPSEGQKKRAQEANVTLTYTPFAREAFVFITHADNPVNSLTQQQVRDIFSGAITRWSEVGGDNRKIDVWQRPEDSGSQSTMLAKVMKETPMLPPKETEVAEGMGRILREVAEYQNSKGAIGYTFRYYATKMNPTAGVKLLAIDGVAPTSETIREGRYPFSVDVYMVTRENPDEKAQKVVRWFLSPQGQALVEDVGYVPLYETLKKAE
jgi:phosphate transport system substrate-binding protein